ncbi:hypothetical protein [Reichenbachiella versicolor]|uniref:hypothetical protein n=1 Tax=Reichenbachiella versicolor TaxID=1821036 RepID=UPI0013A5A82B|nr:hypothetical protein [Reichenbachiella versicolor]
MRYFIVFLILLCNGVATAQHLDSMTQINYGDLPDPIKTSLNDEIAKMDLDAIRFNFYSMDENNNFIVEFIREGTDIKALGGLEMIVFSPGGSVTEKRYKYFSEEILLFVPLEHIMHMQEKVDENHLQYLTKYAPVDGPADYRVIASDSVYIFDENMLYIKSVERKKYLAH